VYKDVKIAQYLVLNYRDKVWYADVVTHLILKEVIVIWWIFILIKMIVMLWA